MELKTDKPLWKEWRMEDGNYAAVLLFPDHMTEKEALAGVLMSGRKLKKLNEMHNESEKTRICEYSVFTTR